MQKKKVFVGLSGGVDSSVTAALLKNSGFNVVGVYIKGWYPDWKECSWKKNRLDAMRVCARLNIPFETLDLSEDYKREVVDYFLEEYKIGRTPNPDVMCNKYIKFGKFYDYALQNGADYVATGHYARIKNQVLLRGTDQDKDQSYFLWTLKKEQLENIIFPLGDLQKSEVRALARKYDSPTKDKKDSQGICFLEDIPMEDFLKHYFPAKKGSVLNVDGQKIGFHHGSILYTIGQRHGFETVNSTTGKKPLFVISKDLKDNTITVSENKPRVKKGYALFLESTNWIKKPEFNKKYMGQSRYRQKPFNCHFLKNGNIMIDQDVESLVSGQSLVIYDGDTCIGGGVISLK